MKNESRKTKENLFGSSIILILLKGRQEGVMGRRRQPVSSLFTLVFNLPPPLFPLADFLLYFFDICNFDICNEIQIQI